jgi:hypothetical protein
MGRFPRCRATAARGRRPAARRGRMTKPPKIGRGVDKQGYSKRDDSHVRQYLADMERPSYKTLSVGARALLFELKALYHGRNNGELYLSVREAAERLGTKSTNSVMDWFWELQDRGWVKPRVAVGFNQKSAARARMATCWAIAEYPTPGAAPTREFVTWEGPPRPRPKTIRRSLLDDSLSSTRDTLSSTNDRPPKSVSQERQIRPKSTRRAPSLSSIRDTDNYHGEGEPVTCNSPASGRPRRR